jgi:hypothetical protein
MIPPPINSKTVSSPLQRGKDSLESALPCLVRQTIQDQPDCDAVDFMDDPVSIRLRQLIEQELHSNESINSTMTEGRVQASTLCL